MGATTFSIMDLIVTLRITTLGISIQKCHALSILHFLIVMLNVVMLNVVAPTDEESNSLSKLMCVSDNIHY
jgi:hypothetical protein